MNKNIFKVFLVLLLFLGACTKPAPAAKPIEEIIAEEMRASFDFFWEQANSTLGSPGYGLIRDRFPGSEGIASMASLGFGLSAYVIGVENEFISESEAKDRINQTLDTLLRMPTVHGFYYHFVDMQTGLRAWNSEVSSIDTGILLMGVLHAGDYFKGEIQTKAKQIYDRVEWPWFVDEERNMFAMAYTPEKGFAGHWDFYAEQLMMYVLAAGSDTYQIEPDVYYSFTRHEAKFREGKPFIHSWFGSIFTYQFSHAWIDFKDTEDNDGVNWYENSVIATQTHYDYAVYMDEKFKTVGPLAWGLTASDGPNGYNGLLGAPPSGFDNLVHVNDDTVAPAGAIGSILFLPDRVKEAMINYASIEELQSQYGFVDAYNLTKEWYAKDVIGIDKGITLLMLANYLDSTVYKTTMGNDNIKKGLERLGIKTLK